MKVSVAPFNIEDHTEKVIPTENHTFSRLQFIIVEQAMQIERIYNERTAGDHTFNGVFSETLQKIQKIAPITNPDQMDHLIKHTAIEATRTYENRTAGDYTFIGIVSSFMIGVNLNLTAQ